MDTAAVGGGQEDEDDDEASDDYDLDAALNGAPLGPGKLDPWDQKSRERAEEKAPKQRERGAKGNKAQKKQEEREQEREAPPDRCGHSGTVHYSWWNKHVANPIREHGYGAAGASAMRLLRGTILEACMLRRTK